MKKVLPKDEIFVKKKVKRNKMIGKPKYYMNLWKTIRNIDIYLKNIKM